MVIPLFAAAKSLFSHVRLCATPETAAHQAPPSRGFSRQEHWSGLPFPSPMYESETWKWSRSVVSDSSQPPGLQPTRLLRTWDFPGKSTGVGCHHLLHIALFTEGYSIKHLSQTPPFLSLALPSRLSLYAPVLPFTQVVHSVVSNSWQPHGLQSVKFLCLWNFPGKNSKNTGVGCHFQGSSRPRN